MIKRNKRTFAAIESSTSSDGMDHHNEGANPRSGKWSAEEESFANSLIVDFETGTLADCEEGCTLRSYLARKLNCAPMRISKKFAGRCIGKVILIIRQLIFRFFGSNGHFPQITIASILTKTFEEESTADTHFFNICRRVWFVQRWRHRRNRTLTWEPLLQSDFRARQSTKHGRAWS